MYVTCTTDYLSTILCEECNEIKKYVCTHAFYLYNMRKKLNQGKNVLRNEITKMEKGNNKKINIRKLIMEVNIKMNISNEWNYKETKRKFTIYREICIT